MTRLTVVEGNITEQEVDAIVNAANSSLLGGGGVDGAIHRAAGPELLAECRTVVARQGGCKPGQAVITGAGLLPCRWVIHTVGPVWSDDRADEHDLTLASCYRSSLDLAQGAKAASIAFPAISSGIYGFPKDRASTVAVAAVRGWVAEHPDSTLEEVRFIGFSPVDAGRYRLRLRR